ncbi:MAG TPA: patatin-like phospholipase family protein [Bryobacteraceae bacterium]|jgi:NTE family protein|nr:patatin-like phospholipase family protein [Bryobacteraceae bacterium]
MGHRKTALVLSAGGMFGAYQSGAFKAIAEHNPPDIVIGASVGALNGWAIAGGCSPQSLAERWLDPDTGGALRLFPNAGWRNGWFDPAPLRLQAEKLYSQFRPLMPFALVAVELPWLRTRLVKGPDVRAAHLQATCSIPLFLPAVKINGRRLLDGGLLDKLPVWAALELGATEIIAIDSLPAVGKWWLRAGTGIVRLLRPARRCPASLHEKVNLTVISPSERLGDVSDAVFWKRENIERWIALGERDADRRLRSEPAEIQLAS